MFERTGLVGALGQISVIAAEPRNDLRNAMIDAKRSQHAPYPVIRDRREEVFQIEIEHITPVCVRLGIRLDRAVRYETMNRIANAIELIEERYQFPLQHLEAIVRSGDEPQLSRAFGDRELLVHGRAIHQIFFSSLDETPRWASKVASLANSAGMAIGMCLPKIRASDGNEVFLPITPGCTSSHSARMICRDIRSQAAVTQLVCEGRPRWERG